VSVQVPGSAFQVPGPLAGPRALRVVRVGLLGYGRVGQAVAALIERESARLAATGLELHVVGALVRDCTKPRGGPRIELSNTADAVLDRPLDVVIEVMGGVEPAYSLVRRALESGTPVAVDGKRLSPAVLIAHLNDLGGAHGVGRVDLVESRLVGMKSHGVYETPGGTILSAAHRELESIVLDRATLRMKDLLALEYADLVYDGQWFSPVREALDAFFDNTQGPVSGAVRLKLYKGSVLPVGRKSPLSLYREDFATFGQEDVYDQADARGFIRLFGLPLKVRALNGLPVSGLDMPQPDYSRFKRD